MRPGGMGARGMTRDRSVLKEDITPGTWRRMGRFIRPYRFVLGGFLGLVVLDAAVSVVNPLLFREIINAGILGRHADVGVEFAGLLAGLAAFSGALAIAEGWVSAKV